MRAGWNLSAGDIIYQERTLSFSGSLRSIKEPSVGVMDEGEASIRKLGFESKERSSGVAQFVFIYCDVYRRLRLCCKTAGCSINSWAGEFESVGIHFILKEIDGWLHEYLQIRQYDGVDETVGMVLGQRGCTAVFLTLPIGSQELQGWCVAMKYRLLGETNSSSNEASFDCVIHSNTQIFIAVLVKAGRISARSSGTVGQCDLVLSCCSQLVLVWTYAQITHKIIVVVFFTK